MTTHAEGFKAALTNIEPQRKEPGDDAANAKLAHEHVREFLTSDTKLQGWGLATELIGSYARRVSIRRVKDVDVFCRLESLPAHLSPGEVLDHFEEVLIEEYGDHADRQARSVKIEFPDYDLSVDAVPARPRTDGNWEVPSFVDARHKWLPTNPLQLNELTTQMNQREEYQLNGKGVYVPTVKLVRQVRRAVLDGDPPGGLYLELMAYTVFAQGLPAQTTFAGYLAETLKQIANLFTEVVKGGLDDPTIKDAKISTKADVAALTSAAEKFRAAAELADSALNEADECRSAEQWDELLGENCDGRVFPIPSYCDTKRLAGNASRTTPALIPSRTAGSDRTPQRDGRFG